MGDVWQSLTAALFDLDGVVTPTASVHARAWATMFDRLLFDMPGQRPFEHDDYLRYVDGRPRYEGVSEFLRSRGIEVPWGSPEDPPDSMTVCGLGNRKNQVVIDLLDREGVSPYPDALRLLDHLDSVRIPAAVVSSSANAIRVIGAAGLGDRFRVRVDGEVISRIGIPGKPAPDAFLLAARELGSSPGEACVLEDAEAGVTAGRAGGFARVFGVARAGDPEPLRRAGADLVVQTLDELIP